MRLCEIVHGEARDVAEYLMHADEVPHGDLVGALANALERIHHLEKRLAKAEVTAAHASNVASCLANGVKPD